MMTSRKSLFRKTCIFAFCLLMIGAFVNCSNSGSDSPPTPPIVVPPPDSGLSFDSWNIPTQDTPMLGLSTAEGWSTPKLVGSPVNFLADGGWTDSVTTTRDGLELYFAYGRGDGHRFLFVDNAMVQTGPKRTDSVDTDYLQLYKATLSSKGYAISHVDVGLGSETLGAPAVNATKDLMAFVSYSGPSRKIKIAGLNTEGTAQFVLNADAPINNPGNLSGCHDDNPFIRGTINSGIIYWQSRRTDAAGVNCPLETDKAAPSRYFYSVITNGVASAPHAIPGLDVVGGSTYEASFSENGTSAYWVRVKGNPDGIFGIMTADSSDGLNFSNPRPLIWISNFSPNWDGRVSDIGEPNVVETSQGSVMFFRCLIAKGPDVNNKPANQQFKICVSKKNK